MDPGIEHGVHRRDRRNRRAARRCGCARHGLGRRARCHGAAPFIPLRPGHREERLEEERESTAAGLLASSEGAHRISADELARRLESADPPLVLDVRTRSQYERDLTHIPGSVRVLPDQVQDWAMRYLAEHHDGEPQLPPITTYCT